MARNAASSPITTHGRPRYEQAERACVTIPHVNLIEKLRRWWAPGEYDDERAPSDGQGFALSDEDYEGETAATPLIPEHEAHP
jgi:hypothetical protein